VDEAIYLSDRILLMTDSPEARVGLDLAVTLDRPRQRRAAGEIADYVGLRSEIIGFLEHHSRQFQEQAA
jgi:ABC-type nitrate/sulfonate/bicarbonate transport system ATPase subunit